MNDSRREMQTRRGGMLIFAAIGFLAALAIRLISLKCGATLALAMMVLSAGCARFSLITVEVNPSCKHETGARAATSQPTTQPVQRKSFIERLIEDIGE